MSLPQRVAYEQLLGQYGDVISANVIADCDDLNLGNHLFWPGKIIISLPTVFLENTDIFEVYASMNSYSV